MFVSFVFIFFKHELSLYRPPVTLGKACYYFRVLLPGLLNLRVRSFGVIWIRINDPRSVWIMVHQRSGESITRVDSLVPLMHHDPDRYGITDPDPDHPKGTHPKCSH